jgi:hypothetical protein
MKTVFVFTIDILDVDGHRLHDRLGGRRMADAARRREQAYGDVASALALRGLRATPHDARVRLH